MRLDSVLLGLLAARTMSGYDVKKWIEEEGRFLGLARHSSQIYRELNRLDAEGSIEHEVDPRSGAPAAKVYRVTDAGFGRLRAWVDSPYEPAARIREPEFVLRLRITAMLDLAAARDLVGAELAARRAQVARHRGRERPFDRPGGAPARTEVDLEHLALVAEAVNAFGETAIDAWIVWLEGLSTTLTESAHEMRAEADR